MKIGLILECGPAGADLQVCEALAHRLAEDITISSVTLDNKPGLLQGCGLAAQRLLQQGCARVLVVWDLFPAWRVKGQAPDRDQDREQAIQSIQSADVNLDDVRLVCISEELEAWLLADGRALSSVLSRDAHKVKIADVKNPERIKNPKKRLNKVFQEKSGAPYVDRYHAIKIVKALPDLTRLDKICSFARFRDKLLGS